ncbi:serine/arginine repetitive matrix protein 1-like [Pecten maximus]|uniref:serine/arginine repetitive matrix protein 1-like n=1 Tax=Pecten maximus TaxID=6579 RepID=UPI001458373F|nr:serine/arginine repetitive matrix protein 1-like [Pecten maximus]XP_033748933.1 serine/arginine repetitive matrix protein 1-like [Pecten maximus]XP_033748935.1 serine/arginine repetitive matrix protein 1-like [Pecten maximus]
MVVQPVPQLLVKKRVLYIGSSVPLETQEGIEAIQQPLRDRYPSGDETQVQGIDAYVSILSTGIQLQYIEDGNLVIFFPITSLTLCAAVRHVKNINAGTGDMQSQFLSLSNPLTKTGNNYKSPAIFSTITRRTKGRRILECHGFLCASDQDAMDLVRATSVVDRKSRGLPPLAPQPVQSEPPPTFRGGASFRSAGPPPTFRAQNGTLDGRGTAKTPNGTANGHATTNGIRLTPGVVNKPRDAPPEFYEPPPSQGYFYSSEKAEAKTFNIEKTDNDQQSPSPPMSERAPTVNNAPPFVPPTQPPGPGPAPKPMYMAAGQPPQPTAVPPPPTQPAPVPPQARQQVPPQPAPQGIPTMRRPVYIHPGAHQPMPHPYLRHLFFSPPPRMRPAPGPYMMPPPPPGMAPFPPHMMPPRPVFVRRPRKPRSLSSSSGSNSRSPSPQKDETHLKNGGDFGSESSISNYRPRTPPRDYDHPRPRMSRREEYERKRDRSRYNRVPVDNQAAYYVYNYPGYQPFPMRSSSVPPHLRYANNTGKKGKKGKKNKKSKKPKNGPASQFSMQSFGYASEIPRGNTYQGWEGFDNPEQVRKPRDFRREENQFMNEKNFSKSIKAETRQSDIRDYPTAYDLNEPAPRQSVHDDSKEDDIGDFTMY